MNYGTERFIPPGYLTLTMAATIAFGIDCHLATYELEEDEKNVNGIGARDVDELAVIMDLGRAELFEELHREPFDAPRFAALIGWPSSADKFDPHRPWTPELVQAHVVYGYRRLAKAPVYQPRRFRRRRRPRRDLHWQDFSKHRIKVLVPERLLFDSNDIPILVNYPPCFASFRRYRIFVDVTHALPALKKPSRESDAPFPPASFPWTCFKKTGC